MTFGASLKQLRAYYAVEIGVSVLLSFLLSLLISVYSIPLFEQILGVQLNFRNIFTPVFLIAIPVAWIGMDKWLENFAFKTDISWWVFALSGVVVLLLLTLFIVLQTWKAATVNPIEVIKSE